MRRRVVHARIRARVVYSCYLIQDKYGLHPETKAMSTVVSEVLESLINRLVEQGDIPSYNDEDADRKISEWLMEVPEDNNLGIQINTDGLAFNQDGEPQATPQTQDPEESHEDLYTDGSPEPGPSPDEEAAGQEVVNTILGYMQQPAEPELFRQDEGDEPSETDEPPLAEIAPWQQDGILGVEQIQEEVKRSDEVAALALNGDDVDIKALQIVYSQIPREMWGSERSSVLIEQVKPTVERYIASGFE